MGIYILNLLMIGFYSLGYSFLRQMGLSEKAVKRLVFGIAMLQMTLLVGLRGIHVGVDVPGYVRNFHFIRDATLDQFLLHRFEIGYKSLTKLIGILTSREQTFLVIIAIISMLPLGRMIYRHSRMPFLSLALYICFGFYSFIFSGLRQAIALAITYISYDFIKKRQLWKFTLTILVASTFHKSAIFFLPAYFIAQLKVTIPILLVILNLNLVWYVFRRQIVTMVINRFFEGYSLVETGAKTWFLFSLFILVVCLFFHKELDGEQETDGLYLLVATGVSLMLFATIATNAMRIVNYYYVYIILLIPEIMYSLRRKHIFVLGGYILLGGMILLYIWSLSKDGYGILPYVPFWK